MDDAQSNWNEYRKLVIMELERLNTKFEELKKEFNELNTKVALVTQTIQSYSKLQETLAELQTELEVVKAEIKSSSRIAGAIAGIAASIIPTIITLVVVYGILKK